MTSRVSTARTVADLSRWTPVDIGLEADTPWVDWGDLRGLRFEDPFVDGTISRWAFSEPPPEVVRTGLEVLAALDAAPSLDPAGFIFHLSNQRSVQRFCVSIIQLHNFIHHKVRCSKHQATLKHESQ